MAEINTADERINAALEVLRAEGLTHIKPEYQADFPRWQAIGLGIAGVCPNAKDVLHLAYSCLEDWNHHAVNLVIEWIASLYGQTFHERDLVTLQRMINKNAVTVITQWNDQKADYDTKRVNVRIVIEELGES